MTNQQNLQIRILHLKNGDNRTSDVLRLQQGQVLRFLLDSSLLKPREPVQLFCNYPLRGAKFTRKSYHEVVWQCSSGMCSAFTDVVADVTLASAGTFHYYFTMDGSPLQVNAAGQGHFLVDPRLMVGGKPLPLDGLCMQTVVSKLLGQFDHWESRLQVSVETGYNVIHFTPVQELGISNSAYCIKDQHRLNSAYSIDKRRTYLMMPHLKDLVDKLYTEHGVLSVTDLVFNHTAVDSPLLERHPECAYNLKNSPHLRPAYLVDRILYHFNLEVARNLWKDHGVPAHLSQSCHLDAMRHVLHCEVFPKYKIPEFYQCDVDETVRMCRVIIEGSHWSLLEREVPLKQDAEFRRNGSVVDCDAAATMFFMSGAVDHIDKGCQALGDHLVWLNQQKEREVWDHLRATIDNFLKNADYRFVAQDGLQLGCVTKDNPIQYHYFVCPLSHEESVEKAEIMMDREPQLVMAVNGWLYGDQPLRNFAEDLLAPESHVYLRRELCPWGDNIKLRYGKNFQACPPLWEHMKIYAETTAKIFHGVRLDNAHSTPVHVGEYMLDAARQVRPDLYVIAELFTGDCKLDNYFVNRLGINALIRELLNAKNTGCLMGMMAGYGGEQLGSFLQPRVRDLLPTGAPAIFYDMTHDNDTPVKLRSEYSLWPCSAVVAMTKCASGSSRGYDELVPHHIDVVSETRLYQKWGQREGEGVDMSMGICDGKRLLNNLHRRLAKEGFTDIHLEDLGDDVVEVVRYNPTTQQSVILVAAMIYTPPWNPKRQIQPKSFVVEGEVEEVLFEGCMVHDPYQGYVPDEEEINGLPSSHFYLELRQNLHTIRSHYCEEKCEEPGSNKVKVTFSEMTPGTVVVLQCKVSKKAQKAVEELEKGLLQYNGMMFSYTGLRHYDLLWKDSAFRHVATQLSLSDLNRVLYHVGVEEERDGFGISAYNIPDYGSLCYCGLRGVMSVLAEVRSTNSMGHTLCHNLRGGPWLMDYIVHRLQITASTKPLGDWLEKLFGHVKNLPAFLKPAYFDAVIAGTYVVLRELALKQFTPFVKEGSTFVQAVALSSIQFLGYVRNARLPPLSPKLTPGPRTELFHDASDKDKTPVEEQAPVSMASGLTHFAEGKWRCWGRDTFISLRGMMLITGRFSDARSLILAYAGTLRHGLIPNLLWEGQDARYNCRDALWWWLHAIHIYTMHAEDGESILQDPVLRLYPTDDTPPNRTGHCEQPLHAVMQEALSRHMAGVQFRERAAGPDLDPYMSEEGFSVEVGVRWPEGYVYGGSQHNCGTWMDFMGRSHGAGNLGRPATPRDGSAVEIVGLSKAALSWLAELSQRHAYPHKGVRRTTPDFKDELVTFEEWARNIQDHFEADFYIRPDREACQDPNPGHIIRRGMYKDCLHASQVWAEYQLRPNFCIAMVVAPELFDEDHAWGALELAQQVLMGPVGMKTLDPTDPHYNGHYSVHGDYNDPDVAAGYNYHNGPEFLWPMAYFLRAKLLFASRLEKRMAGVLGNTVGLVRRVLNQQCALLVDSPWKSLPQLTNKDGAFCEDGNRAHANSSACILEVMYDLERLGSSEHPSAVDLQGPVCTGKCNPLTWESQQPM